MQPGEETITKMLDVTGKSHFKTESVIIKAMTSSTGSLTAHWKRRKDAHMATPNSASPLICGNSLKGCLHLESSCFTPKSCLYYDLKERESIYLVAELDGVIHTGLVLKARWMQDWGAHRFFPQGFRVPLRAGHL